jgi:hypothetical protein
LIAGCAAALILDSGLLSDAISDSPPEKSAFSQKKNKKIELAAASEREARKQAKKSHFLRWNPQKYGGAEASANFLSEAKEKAKKISIFTFVNFL